MRMKTEGVKRKLNNAGMSLVELLCGVAILGLISATIGGIMVVSTKTYYSGTTETALQQEAQFTANRINGLIHDVTNEVNYYYYDSSDALVKANPADGESEQVALINGGTGKDRMIEVVNADKSYQIMYQTAAKQLTYTEVIAGTAGETQVLAEHIKAFSADVSAFEQTRNITMDIEMELNGRSYRMEYLVTSRNGDTEADVSGVHRAAAIIIDPAEVYLEPWQYYDNLQVNVSGSTHGFSQTLQGHSDLVNTRVEPHSTQANTLCITMGKDEAGNSLGHFYVKIYTNETDAGGNPLASRLARVNVRRVNDIAVTKTLTSGTEYTEDAIYDIDAQVIGTYLEKALGTSYDADYISPYDVDFDWVYEKTDGTTLAFDTYFEKLIHKEVKDDDGQPKLQLKLKKDMVAGSKLTITATAKHPAGVNKKGLAYATVQKTVVIERPEEADEIVLNTTNVCLEPQQLYTNMQVTMRGNVTQYDVTLSEQTDTTTSAVKSGTNLIHVKPGIDETGNAAAQFFVNISGTDDSGIELATTQAAVNVRRVTDMNVTSTKSGADYALGTVYTVVPTVVGTHLAQIEGADYDTDYVNPRYVQFDYAYTIGGVAASFDSYFMANEEENSDTPQVKLTLKQAMPANSKLVITMTAKHPAGVNKSGLSYATVQKEFILEKAAEIPYEPVGGWSNILRLDNNVLIDSEGNALYIDDSYKSYYPLVDNDGVVNEDASKNNNPFFNSRPNCQKYKFYRIREITNTGYGEWSEYRVSIEGGDAMTFRPPETLRMYPDKAYQVEFIKAAADVNNKVLYYPFVDELLNKNNGFQGYTAGWAGLGLQQTQQYSYIYNVDAVKMTLDANVKYNDVEVLNLNDVVKIGSAESPIELVQDRSVMTINISTTFLLSSHTQGQISVIGEKRNDATGNWETVNISSSVQAGSLTILVNNLGNAISSYGEGTYRLRVVIKDMTVYGISDSLMSTDYPTICTMDYMLHNEETGSGYIYLKFVKPQAAG